MTHMETIAAYDKAVNDSVTACWALQHAEQALAAALAACAAADEAFRLADDAYEAHHRRFGREALARAAARHAAIALRRDEGRAYAKSLLGAHPQGVRQ